ncbi:MAG: PAS domain S-box protein [Gammaproteobacteria bacterium]|nr:PAS domain S-box protein [Gammaproteobacteria bacterium]
MGQNWAYAFHPDDIEMAQQRWAEATESGEPYEIEYRLRDAQGAYHWVLGRAPALRGQGGAIQNWMGTCTNIDELKYALDAAKTSEVARRDAMEQLEYERARLTNVFEQSPNIMAVLRGPDHVFEFANSAYYELVGYRDLIGKSDLEAMPEIEGQGFMGMLNHVFETGDTVRRNSALVLLQRDESGVIENRYVDFVYQALVDTDGSRVGVIVQGSDVTEQHEAEEQIRFQAGLLDAVGEAVIAISPDGQIIYWNRAAEKIYGWSASETIGRPVEKVFPALQSGSYAEGIMRTLASGNGWSNEILIQDRGGKILPVHVTAAPLLDSEGNFAGEIGVSHDLTERKELEETLRQSQKLEAIGRIAGGISHDFNNVLTTIQGNAELLSMDLHHDSDAMESVMEIEKAALSAAELTRQLLAFSRKQTLQPQIISLTHVISQMKGMLVRVLREDIELRINTPKSHSCVPTPPRLPRLYSTLVPTRVMRCRMEAYFRSTLIWRQ